MGTCAEATGFCRDWMIAEVNFRKAGGQLPPDFAVFHYAAFSYPSEVLGNEELWAKIRRRIEANYGHRDNDFLIAQWQACIDFNVVDKLPGCKVPMHVIAFSEDCQAPAPLGRRVAELAGNGHFHLLQGLGHVSCEVHKPEVVNAEIRGNHRQRRHDAVGPPPHAASDNEAAAGCSTLPECRVSQNNVSSATVIIPEWNTCRLVYPYRSASCPPR